MLIGSTAGGLVPNLWGAGMFSLSSLFFSAAGGLIGIWVGYQLSNI
jgi:hypothetical protein